MATKRTATGASLPERLDAARAAVEAARTARDEIAELPERSRAETRERMRLMLQAAAEDPARTLRAHVLTAQAGHRADGPMLGATVAGDMTGALAALLGVDHMLEMLAPILARIPDGPPSAERARLLADADAALFAAELAEEKIVVQLEAQGLPVVRRADADPRAVLWMDDDAEAAA
ncbi:hypothetical protein [Rubrivivax albus]|uniref:Uncharacterized protein n=1 Tax=Rubrivivax albus TaxID=2499835 RepID=A0A3S2VV53_9BURK|nr:hypothetical protein [Rubrivivax albus]RVT49654.1 hypothetical protein ENE75_18585 [Rubrivivax albus]